MDFSIFIVMYVIVTVSALAVILSKNPVISVLSIVALFVAGAILILMVGADFLAFTLVLVYVGAVLVLFLFVVIMLDIKNEGRSDISSSLLVIGGSAFLAILAFMYKWQISGLEEIFKRFQYDNVWAGFIPLSGWLQIWDEVQSIKLIANVIYTEYFVLFLIAGLVLLLAMVGAIVLTYRGPKATRNQIIFRQIARRPKVAWMRTGLEK